MKGDKIKYSKGNYKYYLREDYVINIPVFPEKDISCRYFYLTAKGQLGIYYSYAWDGASGPTIDTKSSMRGSLVHDVLYQAIRLGLIPAWYKEVADKLLHDICEEDGMWKTRSDVWRWAVEKFGGHSIDPKSEPEVLTAP
jgi:hypothetical protein